MKILNVFLLVVLLYNCNKSTSYLAALINFLRLELRCIFVLNVNNFVNNFAEFYSQSKGSSVYQKPFKIQMQMFSIHKTLFHV